MSGAGKWIKKHPLQAMGLLAGAAVGGPAIAGLFGGAGATTAGAATAVAPELVGGLGAGAADEMLSAVPATFGDKFGTFAGNAMLGIDKMAPYAKLAGQAQGLLATEQPQMPVAQPQGYRGPGPQIPTQGIYDDPDLKKRMAMMAQTGRFYG
jgi:hypothetical protein